MCVCERGGKRERLRERKWERERDWWKRDSLALSLPPFLEYFLIVKKNDWYKALPCMPVTHERSDNCLFTQHQTLVCSKQYAAQLEPMAPLPEKDGGLVVLHSAGRTAHGRPCSLHLSSSVGKSHAKGSNYVKWSMYCQMIQVFNFKNQ